jgi:alginate O-acetyltransferase complex protein AlgI
VLFNSYSFILFLACVLWLHNLPLPWRIKKFNLLWASYLFYAAWNPPFVVLLWISTLVDWHVGKRLHRADSPAARKALLLASLAVNLGLLGFFKYGGFLLDNFVALAHLLGVPFQPAKPDIVLPVGISFYTFQTLSYTLDIYLRKARPWHSFLDYAMYVTFFPQLVAGPIVRAVQFLPQCLEPKRVTAGQLTRGLGLLLLGLFEKIVLADGLLAPAAERIFDSASSPDTFSAWCGTLAFSGQIFCDFAGYSTCAIGVGRCLGFNLPQNFRFPYAASGFSDFWRRWHISLSTWLRDYLYISLGGNRRGELRTYVNLMLTMLIGGLWHGASWNFVVWGGLHGVYLAIERVLRERFPRVSLGNRALPSIALALFTFGLVCFTWVFFRAHTLDQALAIAQAMLGVTLAGAQPLLNTRETLITLFTMAALLTGHWWMRNRSLEAVAEQLPWWLRSLVLAGMMVAIVAMSGEDRAFIYFQF